jgi:hypothetical protein
VSHCTFSPSGEFSLRTFSSYPFPQLKADQNRLSRNVMTLSSILASSPISAVRRIGIIGVGGVTSSAAYKRMKDAGAAAVACATALGINGVGIFQQLLVGEWIDELMNRPLAPEIPTSDSFFVY